MARMKKMRESFLHEISIFIYFYYDDVWLGGGSAVYLLTFVIIINSVDYSDGTM